MSDGEIDLTAFPVVRLDQIGLLNDEQLARAITEVGDLLRDANAPQQKMTKYLAKQYDLMSAESNQRKAALRVQQLLSGALDSMETYSPRIPSSTELLSSASSQKNITPFGLGHDSTPVPPASEKLKVLKDMPLSATTRDQMETKSTRSRVEEGKKLDGTSFQPSKEFIPLTSAALTASSSAVSTSSMPSEVPVCDTPRSVGSSKSGRSRRPLSAIGGEEDNGPSKKSVDIVYRNFGSEFIVAATEKKRRFAPKKKAPEESVEEIKNRERLERRKAAMESLMRRREQQEEMRAKQRERRRQEKLKQRQEHERATRIANGDDSDASESVSGGDDDYKIEIDENMIQGVQSSVINDDGKRTFVVAAAPMRRNKSIVAEKSGSTKSSPAITPNAAGTSRSNGNTHANQPNRASSVPPPVRVSPRLPLPPKVATNNKKTGLDDSVPKQQEILNKSRKPPPEAILPDNDTSSLLSGKDSESDRAVRSSSAPKMPPQPASVGDDNSNSIHEESVADADLQDNDFSSKNQSALLTIRRMREAKLSKSILVTTVAEEPVLSKEPVPIDQDQQRSVATTEPTYSNTNKAPILDNDAPAYVPTPQTSSSVDVTSKLDSILAQAMVQVDRASTPLLTTARSRPTSSSSLHVPSKPQLHNTTAGTVSLHAKQVADQFLSDLSAAPSATLDYTPSEDVGSTNHITNDSQKDWDVDYLLSYLTRALHRQRIRFNAEIDILQILDRTVMFNFGPDDLPGLRAFQLIPGQPITGGQSTRRQPCTPLSSASLSASSGQFVLNLDLYHDRRYSEENAEVFDYRSSKRREVSLGLVLLAIYCHDILFGQVDVGTDVEAFHAAWLKAIQRFDDAATKTVAVDDNSYGEQHTNPESMYFALLPVCGNGYALCKKLEVLVEQYFTPLMAVTASTVNAAAAVDARDISRPNSSATGRFGLLSSQGKDPPLQNSMVRCLTAGATQRQKNDVQLQEQQQQRLNAEQAGDGVAFRVVDDAHLDQTMNDNDIHRTDDNTADGVGQGDDDGNDTAMDDAGDRDDADADDDADDDDVVDLRPVDGDEVGMDGCGIASFSSTKMIAGSNNGGDEHDAALDYVLNQQANQNNKSKSRRLSNAQNTTKDNRHNRTGVNAGRTRRSNADSTQSYATAGTDTKSSPSSNSDSVSPLIDYYPQFAAIFPMAYSQSHARDDTGYARTILESMQVQAQVYEEWVEVMRDYSTVFCHNDDIGSSKGSSQQQRPRRRRPDGDNENEKDKDDPDGDNSDSRDATDVPDRETQQARSASVYRGGTRSLHYRVKSSRPEVSNIVADVFANHLHNEWEPLPAGLGLGLSWNLLWTWSKPRINRAHLLVWQRVNHFDESRQLTRKDFLKKNLQRYTDMAHSSAAAREFEIMPQTFLLPHEYNAFVAAFTSQAALQKAAAAASNNANGDGNQVQTVSSTSSAPVLNYWILKPVGLSRGRGISLIKDLGDLTYAQASVVQKYIENPLCLSHFKFDLRIYVVVTSFRPLEAFIYRDGFARVSLEAYSLDPKDMSNLFIHLTNSSIQKKHVSGPSKDNPLHQDVNGGGTEGENVDVGGSKISLLGTHGLWKRLTELSQGRIDCDEVWRSICTLIVKSLVVVEDKIPHQPCAFELFGYDVLIDENLRPWLIEVNASPSLARENALDHRVKNAVIRDIIQLLDVAPYDRAALARIMRRRLTNIAKNRHLHGRNDGELEQDLQDILGDYRPRRPGELPKKMGQFERLAPETPYHQHVMKLRKRLFKDGP